MSNRPKANKGPMKINWERVRALRISFLFLLCACNQEQFYEKQYLDASGKKLKEVSSAPSSAIAEDAIPGGDGTVGGLDPIPNPDPTPTPSPGLCNGTGYQEANDQFVQNSGKEGKVDIIWVVDNSGSMGDEQDALAKNFDAFIGDFVQKKIDFKMAVVTTDATKKHDGKIVGNSDVLLTSAKAQENEAKFMNDFKSIVNVGINGSGKEAGLHTSESFLKNNAASFLRNDAFLIVIVISDEEDQSMKKVDEYVNYYRSFKVNPGMMKFYSIVTTENTSFKWETIGNRYIDASIKTGGVYSNIKNDFYSTLSNMGGRIVDLLDSFALSGVPFNSQFKVLVDGTEQINGWSYDQQARTIKFDQGSVPAEGSIVIVYYNVACTL